MSGVMGMQDDFALIYLEPDEQLNRVIQSIQDCQQRLIAFVVRGPTGITSSSINLELMNKRLREENKEAVFITDDLRLKKILEDEGWQVFENHHQLIKDRQEHQVVELVREEEEEYHTGLSLKAEKKKGKWLRRFLLLAFLLFPALIWFYYNYYSVVIQVSPARESMTREFQLQADLATAEVDVEEGLVPLQRQSIKQELNLSFPATGSRKVGISAARGSISLVNDQDQSVNLPVGTILLGSGGEEFETTSRVTIPAVEVDYLMDVVVGMKAGQTEVEIRALEKGSSGNLQAGEINRFADQDLKLKVVNPEPTEGGRDQEEKYITTDDLRGAEETVQELLEERVLNSLREQIEGEHLLLEDPFNDQQLSLESEFEKGQITEEFSVQGEISGDYYYLLQEDLEYVIAKSFNDNLESGYRLTSIPLQLKKLEVEGREGETLALRLRVEGQVEAEIDPQHLASSLRGESLTATSRELSQMKEIRDYKILDRDHDYLPAFGFGIRVVVEE